MELHVQIQPEGDTTPGEIAEITAKLRLYFKGLPEVDTVSPVRVPAPEGAKGWVDAVGALAIKLIPGGDIAKGALDVVKTYAARPGSPPFSAKFTADGGEFTFDPRTGSLEQFAAFMAIVKPQPKTA
jgi:hypothetical protein